MKIDNLEKLRIVAAVNQKVFDILGDSSIGRRKAAELISGIAGTSVSEKLVRTYRDKRAEEEAPLADWERDLLEGASPVMPEPSGPVRVVNAVHIEDPALYRQEVKRVLGTTPLNIYADGTVPFNHEDRLSRYTEETPVGPVTEHTAMKQVPSKRDRKKTSYNIVIMPDVQAPLHDEKLVDKFVQFLADYEPDQLGQVGDFTDSTEISRWVRGKKGEFAGDLQQGLDSGSRILEKIRDVYDGLFQIVRSNHDDRLELYIAGCAPGLEGLRALTIESLAGFDEYEVQFVRDGVVNLTPGLNNPWIMCHGDEGSMSPVAGKTAFNLAKNKFGANVVCGHTHKAGFTSESYGFNGQINRRLSGLEVGHFMDMTKADYLKKKGVAANWQQAFGIIEVCGATVQANLIDVDINGNFIVDGVLY